MVIGGWYGDGRGKMRGTEGEEREKTEATATTATVAGGRRQTTADPSECRKDNVAGGKYCVGGSGMEESADESAKWSREDTEELVSEE